MIKFLAQDNTTKINVYYYFLQVSFSKVSQHFLGFSIVESISLHIDFVASYRVLKGPRC